MLLEMAHQHGQGLPMDPRLQAIIESTGVFLRWEALELGYDDRTLAKLMRHKILHRVRRGAYTYKALWESSSSAERHRIHCRAVMRSMGDNVALSHVSNLVMRGVSVWGVDLSRVHVTRLDGGSGRIEPDVVHHRGQTADSDIELIGGLAVTRVDRALMESLIVTGVETGLIMADSALHLEVVTPDELHAMHQRMERWPGMRSAQLVTRLADGRAESPGETRVRYICWEQGLPKPELQVPVYDSYGACIAVTDFCWEDERLFGEFDGKVKYKQLLRPGQQPSDVVFDEKIREDAIREATGFGLIRYIWQHLADHAGLAARTRRKFRRAA